MVAELVRVSSHDGGLPTQQVPGKCLAKRFGGHCCAQQPPPGCHKTAAAQRGGACCCCCSEVPPPKAATAQDCDSELPAAEKCPRLLLLREVGTRPLLLPRGRGCPLLLRGAAAAQDCCYPELLAAAQRCRPRPLLLREVGTRPPLLPRRAHHDRGTRSFAFSRRTNFCIFPLGVRGNSSMTSTRSGQKNFVIPLPLR